METKYDSHKRIYEVEKFTSDKIGRIEMPETNFIDALPEELFLLIFSNLAFYNELGLIPLVSKKWKRMSDDEQLSSFFLFKFYGKSPDPSIKKSPKLQLKEAIELEKKIASEYPGWIKKAFGGARAIASLPTLNTQKSLEHLHCYCLSESCKDPLTLLVFDDGSSGLMFRYLKSSNPLDKICTFLLFHDGKYCGSNIGWRFESYTFNVESYPVLLDKNPSDVFPRLIYKDMWIDEDMHWEFLENYFTRFVQKRPCGDIDGFREQIKELDPSEKGSCKIYLA